MSRAYYNEIDPAAAHVLRALIADGVIAPGDVDDRSIKDVRPDDVRGYAQCHFFAGGGLWSVAARLADWPDDRPLWTGSCPCQPFSVAGKGVGSGDPRHLWPDFFRLIRAARPAVVVGEQVAGAAGYGWFDGIAADLEGENYAGRAVDVPACAVDAPHIRQRLWWAAIDMADADGRRRGRRPETSERSAQWRAFAERPGDGAVEHADGSGLGECGGAVAIQPQLADAQRAGSHAFDSHAFDLEHAAGERRREGRPEFELFGGRHPAPESGLLRRNGSFWSDHEWRVGADGKARRAKPDLRLLVDGLPGRVGMLRIAGNAIVPVLAAEILAALWDAIQFDQSGQHIEAA